MTQTYEVEVKSLLGSPERAEEVRKAMKKADAACTMTSKHMQLNHYFEYGSLEKLSEVMAPYLSESAKKKLADFAARAKSFSVRTRDKDGTVLLVVKASVGDDSSENGVARMEFEEEVRPLAGETLDELDRLILSAGFSYQAKWSREREEYTCCGLNITLDKNAGYGWLAEFEKVVDDASRIDQARKDICAFMGIIDVAELPQDRLERMFAYYNEHWPEYYGTEKIFTIE